MGAVLNLIQTLWRRAGPWIKRGDEANRAHNWEQARHAYSTALQINPDLHYIWIQYGHVLSELGQIHLAVQAYRRATTLRPDLFDAHLRLGHAQLRTGEKEVALATFRHALKLVSGHPETTELIKRLSLETSPVRAEQIDLLTTHGIGPAFLSLFDWEYYLFANGLAESSSLMSEVGALRHFLDSGIDRLLPTHDRWGFDADYYRLRYRIAASTPSAIYRAWLTEGVDAGRSPNIIHEIEMRLSAFGLDMPLVEQALGARADLIKKNPDKAVELFLKAANGERPLYVRNPALLDGRNVQFFSSVADTIYLRGERERAIVHREAILARVPHHPATQQHLADAHLDAGRPGLAADFYRMSIKSGIESPWTYLNLARCLREVGDVRGELAVIEAAARRFPLDRGFARELVNIQDRFFAAAWTRAAATKEDESIASAQGALAEACARIAPTPDPRAIAPRLASGRRAVALVANEGLEQCRLYRVEQKIEQLRAAGCEVEKFNSDHELDAFIAALDRFDVVIFYRVPAVPAMMRAIHEANVAGLATVYEIDDLLFDAEHYPPAISDYGGLVAHAEYVGLATGVPLFRHAMRMCDYALASTPALAEAMAPLVRSGRSFVHRNALGDKHRKAISVPPLPPRADKIVTILYGSGTKAHKEDFTELLEPALVEIARRYDYVRVVLVGFRNVGPSLSELGDRLVLIDPITEVQAYWRILSEADISLSVLKPSLMADCKSEIKWLEAAMLGIPSVLSATRTHKEVVRHGETGFLCRTVAEWIKVLDQLVSDEALRRKVGRQARDQALRDYGEPAMAANIASILADVMPPASVPRKRIAVVNVFYPPQAIGGATRVVRDNVRSFVADHGDLFDIEVFTSIEGEPDGYRVIRQIVDGVLVTGVTTPSDPLIDHRMHDRRMAEIFGDFLDAAQVDLVHFHCVQRLTVDVVGVAGRRDIPYIITAHDGWWISDEQFLIDRHDNVMLYDYALSPIERQQALDSKGFQRMSAIEDALSGAHRVLPVSEPFAQLYRSAGVRNVQTIANGVSRLPRRHRTPAPDARLRLAHIGGMSRHKGYHLVRQALWSGDYRNLSLTVIDHAMSSGTYRDELWGTTPVRVLPRIEQKDIAALYHATDILLAPSIWPESHGLVTREALASGCWVIASDRGAIGSDVVDGVNGHVISVGNVDALMTLLRSIDADPERYRSVPAQIPKFRTASEQASELATLYLELLEQGKAITDATGASATQSSQATLGV